VALWKQFFLSNLSSKKCLPDGWQNSWTGPEECLKSHMQNIFPLLLPRGQWFYWKGRNLWWCLG
jgi:hypothetical protein